MRALWVHDHPFVRLPHGAVASRGKFPAIAWERYLEVFNDLTVVGRDGGAHVGAHQVDMSSREGVRHVLLQAIHSPRGLISNLSARSEEHTSELQSRGHLVCRLLLEK